MSQKSTLASPDSLAPTSPFSTHSVNLSNSSISVSHSTADNSPVLITSATYKKPTTKHVTQLSTSSPAGIAVANQVTPQRLASLLLTTGPLAIRHITSNLAIQISGFEKLSLSKQRRLIMNCLNQGYEEGSIVFQKIGWGQWTAKKVEPEEFVKERNALRISNAKVKDDETSGNGPSPNGKNIATIAANARRESITKNRYELDHHDKLLNSRRNTGGGSILSKSHPVKAIGGNHANDFAILSDDEDDDAAISATSDFYDDSDSESDLSSSHRHQTMFRLEDEERIPPLKLSTRSHNISPTSTNAASRRSSFNKTASAGITKPKFAKLRSNSMTPTSPELRYYTTTTAAGSMYSASSTTHSNGSHVNIVSSSTAKLDVPKSSHSTINSRRHSSIRSTLSIDQELDSGSGNADDDTDEEDWESIGAIRLLRNLKNATNHVGGSSNTNADLQQHDQRKDSGSRDEEDAAFALVNLRAPV